MYQQVPYVLIRRRSIANPSPLGTVPGLSTAGAVRAWPMHCVGLLQVAAVQAKARVTPERGQGHYLMRSGQRLAAMALLRAPSVGNADAGHHA